MLEICLQDQQGRADCTALIKSPDFLFDIEAKAPPETAKDQLRLMMQALLEERFGLKLHHEQREMRYVALMVDKKGSKLHESEGKPEASTPEVRPGHIAVRRTSVGTRIVLLGLFTSMPIVDMTALKGSYDVKLEWSPRGQKVPLSGDAPSAAEAANGPNMFDALQQQRLGLKADMRRGPLDVIVVDYAEKIPLAN